MATLLLLPALGVVWPLLETCRLLERERKERQPEQEERALIYFVCWSLGCLLEPVLDGCVGR